MVAMSAVLRKAMARTGTLQEKPLGHPSRLLGAVNPLLS